MPGIQMQVSGAAQLANLSKALKAAGQGQLRRELLAGIRKAAAPAKTTIPQSAREKLPRRGGLNETVASALKVTSRTSLSGSSASVRIVCIDPPNHDIGSMNAGEVRKPLFGDRKHWYGQRIPPGFFTDPCVALAPGARQQIAAARDRVISSLIHH